MYVLETAVQLWLGGSENFGQCLPTPDRGVSCGTFLLGYCHVLCLQAYASQNASANCSPATSLKQAQ